MKKKNFHMKRYFLNLPNTEKFFYFQFDKEKL